MKREVVEVDVWEEGRRRRNREGGRGGGGEEEEAVTENENLKQNYG